MPVLSSDEYIELEDNRMRSGLSSINSDINEIVSSSFGHSVVSDSVEIALKNNEYIGFLEIGGKPVATGFGKKDDATQGKTMYIHSFAVNNENRGQGLCQKIVSEFIKRFGKRYILYLTVRTEEGDVNDPAIECYKKNGFIMLPEVYRDHYDGKNSAMIRIPHKVIHPGRSRLRNRSRLRSRARKIRTRPLIKLN